MGISEGEERNKGTEKTFEEILAENIPNLMKNINLYIQAQLTPSRINSRDLKIDI